MTPPAPDDPSGSDPTDDESAGPERSDTEHTEDNPTEGQLAAVRDLLAALPPVTTPTTVIARINAALAAEAAQGPVGRSAPPSRVAARPALAAAAAALVVIGGGAILLRGGPETQTASDSAAAGSAALPETAPDDAARDDGAGSLPTRVRALLDGSSSAARSDAPGAGGMTSGSAATVPQACLQALGVDPSRVRAAERTTYDDSPVLLLVLSRTADSVDVRVVGLDCGAGGADLQHRLDNLRLR